MNYRDLLNSIKQLEELMTSYRKSEHEFLKFTEVINNELGYKSDYRDVYHAYSNTKGQLESELYQCVVKGENK